MKNLWKLIREKKIIQDEMLHENSLIDLIDEEKLKYLSSIAKGFPFRKRFFEMAALSLSIAAINFLIGYGIKHLFNLQI